MVSSIDPLKALSIKDNSISISVSEAKKFKVSVKPFPFALIDFPDSSYESSAFTLNFSIYSAVIWPFAAIKASSGFEELV